MLKYGNKEFRNLEEQVYKNKSDIEFILEEEGTLNKFGIKVVGEIESEDDLPTVAEYKEDHDDWAYGDAYAIGTEPPYDLHVLTRANGTHASDYWFNIGSFPMPGAVGPTGATGAQALILNSIMTYYVEPHVNDTVSAGPSEFNRTPVVGDTFICIIKQTSGGNVVDTFIATCQVTNVVLPDVTTGKILKLVSIRGSQGVQGVAGDDGLAYGDQIEVTYISLGTVINLDGGDFNRLPKLGDYFIGLVRNTVDGKLYLAVFEVVNSPVSPVPITQCKVIACLNTQGPDGKAGEAGNFYKDVFEMSDISAVSYTFDPTKFTSLPSPQTGFASLVEYENEAYMGIFTITSTVVGATTAVKNSMIKLEASGGTSDFDELTNRPKYNGSAMTHSTNIPEVKSAAWDAKSTVSVSISGSATDEIQYITIDGVEKKIAGWSGIHNYNELINKPIVNADMVAQEFVPAEGTHYRNINEAAYKVTDFEVGQSYNKIYFPQELTKSQVESRLAHISAYEKLLAEDQSRYIQLLVDGQGQRYLIWHASSGDFNLWTKDIGWNDAAIMLINFALTTNPLQVSTANIHKMVSSTPITYYKYNHIYLYEDSSFKDIDVDAVSSVNSKTGAVVLKASDISATNTQSVQANLERIDSSVEGIIDAMTGKQAAITAIELNGATTNTVTYDSSEGINIVGTGEINGTDTISTEFNIPIIPGTGISIDATSGNDAVEIKVAGLTASDIGADASNSVQTALNYLSSAKPNRAEVVLKSSSEVELGDTTAANTFIDFHNSNDTAFSDYQSRIISGTAAAYVSTSNLPNMSDFGIAGKNIYMHAGNVNMLPDNNTGAQGMVTINSLPIFTTGAPANSSNNNNALHIAVLNSAPATYKRGWIYFIDGVGIKFVDQAGTTHTIATYNA